MVKRDSSGVCFIIFVLKFLDEEISGPVKLWKERIAQFWAKTSISASEDRLKSVQAVRECINFYVANSKKRCDWVSYPAKSQTFRVRRKEKFCSKLRQRKSHKLWFQNMREWIRIFVELTSGPCDGLQAEHDFNLMHCRQCAIFSNPFSQKLFGFD